MSSPAEAPRVTLRQRMEAALPARYRGVHLADFDPERSPGSAKAHAAARRFVAGEADALVLVGRPGVGKTLLLAGVCKAIASALDTEEAALRRGQDDAIAVHEQDLDRWLAEGRTGDAPERPVYRDVSRLPWLPAWLGVPEALVDLRSEFGAHDRPMAERVAWLRSHRGVVVLDDLGREKVSDWTSETLYVLVDARYGARLRTAVSTNLTLAELAETSYWPIISRLADNGLLVEIEAPDQRLRARVR